MTKKKAMRVVDILTRFIDTRPDEESYEDFSRRLGLPGSVNINTLNKRRDINTGLMYRIAKAFGYQVIFYNPKPPEGLNQMYVVGVEKCPLTPRERRNKVHITRDPYTGEKFRAVRKYKKQAKKFTRITHND